MLFLSLLLLTVVADLGYSLCPFRGEHADQVQSLHSDSVSQSRDILKTNMELAKNLDWEAVKQDLMDLMVNSQAEWPADYGHYGPLFVRLAWHTAGSYRTSDGRGGADGARQRFEPERSWDDNTNLDKARSLLWPIKMKYGAGLSWGDLMVLSGNVAIESMGLTLLGFCAGRIDDIDGSESLLLGPTPQQNAFMPCATNGNCTQPLGASTLGLIYVNPEGPMGIPNPSLSVQDIRDTFGRMSMDDRETVALIGGGHAFGKTHGACPTGAGLAPKDDPLNPWPGTCGSGKGQDTFTSGFEFPFTTNPIRWDNEYFHNLINFDWKKMQGPGGKYQWKVTRGVPPVAPSANGNETQEIGMLTSDVALMHDPIYRDLVHEYANDIQILDRDFRDVWYKLTTRDMGPHSRCIGPMVPPPQSWQYPLPQPNTELADFSLVKNDLKTLLDGEEIGLGLFVRLAWRCSATYRHTDYLGGCNGARIRLSPQRNWTVNRHLDVAFEILEPIKNTYGSGLSWADLIILAGNTALEMAGVESIPFCGGRTDAERDDGASKFLKPKITGNFGDSLEQLKETARLMGLTQRELAVLNAGGYSIGDSFPCEGLFCPRIISSFKSINTSIQLSNLFFVRLLTESWEEYTEPQIGRKLYKAVGKDHLYMFGTDLWYKTDGELRAIAEDYYYNNTKFVTDFTSAWYKLTTVDRFSGPAGNVCWD